MRMSTVQPSAPVLLSATGAPFAGFWIRVVALLIDNFAVTVVYALLIGIFGNGVGDLLGLIVGISYHVYFLGGKWQATPGKRLLGIHVIRTDGAALTYQRALGRYFSYILSWAIMFIGFIMVAFTQEKTGLHDLICDTRVVYGKR